MIYRTIQGLDKKVSAFAYGCAGDVMQSGADNSEILDASFEAGINFFDTARCYGDSEISLGNWIKQRKNRQDVVVLSKGCHPKPQSLQVHRVSEKAIKEDLDTSLRLLQTDYIDIYLLHRDDTSIPVSELVGTLDDMRKQGKILNYGVSNWTLDRFKEAQAYAKEHDLAGFSVNSPNYSLAEQVNDPWESGSEAISISGNANKEAREYFTQNQIPIVAYSSLARGLFSGKFRADEANKATQAMDQFAMKGYYSEANIEKLRRVEELAKEKNATVSQIALAYLLSQELQVHPVVAYSKLSHMEDNVKALDIRLIEKEIQYLEG